MVGALAEAVMRRIFLTLPLLIASLLSSPLRAASPAEVVAKFEALQKAILSDPKGDAFQRFVIQERVTPAEWALGLEAAMHPPLNKGSLGVLFEAYLWQTTKDMDPRDRADLIKGILDSSEEPELLIRSYPILIDANVDARNKYFTIDGGDLDLVLKARVAKRARGQLKTTRPDELRAGRLRRLAAALEPDPQVLADFVRSNTDEQSVKGLSDNTSRLAHPKVLAAFLDSPGNEARGLSTARLLYRLNFVGSVPKERKADLVRKMNRVRKASKRKREGEAIDGLRRRMEVTR
jgi:hypothetical protein